MDVVYLALYAAAAVLAVWTLASLMARTRRS